MLRKIPNSVTIKSLHYIFKLGFKSYTLVSVHLEISCSLDIPVLRQDRFFKCREFRGQKMCTTQKSTQIKSSQETGYNFLNYEALQHLQLWSELVKQCMWQKQTNSLFWKVITSKLRQAGMIAYLDNCRLFMSLVWITTEMTPAILLSSNFLHMSPN